MITMRRPDLITGSYQRSDGLTMWRWNGGTDASTIGRADIDSPSYVCTHPELPMAYAVSELDEGLLTTLAIDTNGALTPLGSMPTGGAHPCWVTPDPSGVALLIANYDATGTASSMAVIGLSEDGIPVGDAIVTHHSGSGPVAGRQSGAHVHQVVPTADGHVLASDLGSDELVEYMIDQIPGVPHGRVTVTEVGRTVMPTGSGPRHIALAADGMTGFVSGELDGTVTMIRRRPGEHGAAGRWHIAGQTPCSHHRAVDGGDDPGFAAPSHITLVASDRYLLVANRGPHTLAVLDVTDGTPDDLPIVGETPVAAGPRDFTVHGNTIFVACQQAGVVEVHRLDPDSGQVSLVGELRHEDTTRIPDVSRVALFGT